MAKSELQKVFKWRGLSLHYLMNPKLRMREVR